MSAAKKARTGTGRLARNPVKQHRWHCISLIRSFSKRPSSVGMVGSRVAKKKMKQTIFMIFLPSSLLLLPSSLTPKNDTNKDGLPATYVEGFHDLEAVKKMVYR